MHWVINSISKSVRPHVDRRRQFWTQICDVGVLEVEQSTLLKEKELDHVKRRQLKRSSEQLEVTQTGRISLACPCCGCLLPD